MTSGCVGFSDVGVPPHGVDARGFTRKYGDAYATLQPRVAKTLVRAFLDPLKPLSTHYGAIQALAALGAPVVRALLLPNVQTYVKLLEPQLRADSSEASAGRVVDARRCYNALLVRSMKRVRRRSARRSRSRGVHPVRLDGHASLARPTHRAPRVLCATAAPRRSRRPWARTFARPCCRTDHSRLRQPPSPAPTPARPPMAVSWTTFKQRTARRTPRLAMRSSCTCSRVWLGAARVLYEVAA